jgi:hypothetical protein
MTFISQCHFLSLPLLTLCVSDFVPLLSVDTNPLLYPIGPSLIGESLPFPSNDLASPGSSTVRVPPYAPSAQAYPASRLRRFRQTVFASSAILPAGCMGGLSLAAAFC